jgi:4-carboxymuconolactone decarboxylase
MTSNGSAQNNVSALAEGDAPVLEELAQMTVDTLERSNLDARTYMLVRIAALVAMDAAPISYLMNLGLAAETGVAIEDIQGVLVAVAPVVGTARVVSAASGILGGLGLLAGADEG